MVANVTTRDGVFTVRNPAWWDLDGTHDLADYPTREEAQQIAHPWEPEAEPVYRRVLVSGPGPDASDPASPDATVSWERYVEIEDQHLLARSDDGYALGVVNKTYEPVTNTEMWDIAEALQGEADDDLPPVQFETGGSLLGGRKVWVLIRLRDPILIPGDPRGETIMYYALQNNHDGLGAFRGQATNTRIVCDNTSKMADLDAQARGTEFVFRHTSGIRERVEEAKAALAGWRTSISSYRDLSANLLDTKVTPEQIMRFTEEFIPMPLAATVSDRVVTNVEESRAAYTAILHSETCEGIEYTAYGLVQASVEYLEHARRARSAQSRFKRAYLDRNVVVSQALDLAREVSLA